MAVYRLFPCPTSAPGLLQFWSEPPLEAKHRFLHETGPEPTLRRETWTVLPQIACASFSKHVLIRKMAPDHQNHRRKPCPVSKMENPKC